MKKTTLLKSLLKSPPISAKSFKSTQKYQFTPTDLPDYPTAQQTLKMKMEKLNDSLNHEIKQRQYEFKQLYKMITDLQKTKKSKCKHNLVAMERNPSPREMTHIPFTVLQNNSKSKKFDQASELYQNLKQPFSINEFSQLCLLKKQNTEINMMKKENRKSKVGTIKSHKYLPTIYSSTQSIQMQNEEDIQEDKKSHLETTTSQFFSNSHSYFNFNIEQKEVLSPSQSILSNSSMQKAKNTVEFDLKITYFENKLKSLESSHNFLKEKVDTNFLKHNDFAQQLKGIDSKLENHSEKASLAKVSEEIEKKLKQIECNLNKKYQEISLETTNNFKNIQSLIFEREKQKIQHAEKMTDLLTRIESLETSQNEVENSKIQKTELDSKLAQIQKEAKSHQTEIMSRIKALESAQGDLFKEFGDLAALKDEKLECSKIREVPSLNQSFAEPSFYTDKMSEVESRLENTEEIVSELMKVSLTLTEKINKLTNYDEKSSKGIKQGQKGPEKSRQNKGGLSESYWSLKEELNKIDEEAIESSREVIDESFVYNEENEEESSAIKIEQEIKQAIKVEE